MKAFALGLMSVWIATDNFGMWLFSFLLIGSLYGGGERKGIVASAFRKPEAAGFSVAPAFVSDLFSARISAACHGVMVSVSYLNCVGLNTVLHIAAVLGFVEHSGRANLHFYHRSIQRRKRGGQPRAAAGRVHYKRPVAGGDASDVICGAGVSQRQHQTACPAQGATRQPPHLAARWQGTCTDMVHPLCTILLS